MAIKGSLREASLSDVLQLLALGRKTGCLAVADRENFGHIYFQNGRITYASIVNRRDRLGDLLVKNGEVTSEHVSEAIDEQREHPERRLGRILVEMGAISESKLRKYIEIQIEEAVYFLFTWNQGTFNFEADLKPENQDFLSSINAESLLLEGARRVDEWSLIAKKIPSLDLVFKIDRDRLGESDAVITDEQRRLLPLCDGSRDVIRLIEDSGMGEFDVGKALYGLITAGFAQRAGRATVVQRDESSAARVDEHRNLGVAFFKSAMLEEAGREFRRVAELRPEDSEAYFYLGLVALRQARFVDAVDKLRRAAEKGGNRPPILHNLAVAHERLGDYERAETAYAEAAARGEDDPRIYTGWGIAALKRGNLSVAEERLDRARMFYGSRPPPALWYWARMLTAAQLGTLELAEALAREALEHHPDHAVIRNNLAVLLELAGAFDEAEGFLEAALRDTPSLPQLSKNFGDVRYRAGRYDEAWEAYRRAIALDPELGEDIYFKLGNIAYKRNDRDAATTYWERAVEINPRHELARANLDTVSALT